tara:strand:- start:6375 stop:7109 length:735 start_codon:yes stop_codon:yes gene_type:complete
MSELLALRMDDVGASSKKFNVYSKYPLCNTLFIKYIPPFRAWGPYEEISSKQWKEIFRILEKYNAKLTVGVTACYVEKNSTLIPFNIKFPDQAEILLEGVKDGLIEVANHGLSHCVIGKHLPKSFSSNRANHREFWDYLPKEWHQSHLKESQKILEDWLKIKVETFIPPGNVYCIETVIAAEKYGIKKINSSRPINNNSSIKTIDEKNILAFHDRELVLYGNKWLEKKLQDLSVDKKFVLLRDL